jgi:hypothetical protein
MRIKVYVVEWQAPRWLKKLVVFGVLPVAVLIGLGVGVRAANLTTFSPGAKLSAVTINGNFDALNTDIAAINAKLPTGTGRLTLLTRYERVTYTTAANSTSGWKTSKGCGADMVVGGGCEADTATPATNAYAVSSMPEGDHWDCNFKNNSAAAITSAVYVVCAKLVVM